MVNMSMPDKIGKLFSLDLEHRVPMTYVNVISMEKRIIVNICFRIILFALFSWQTLCATLKYLEKTTYISTSDVDEGSILFPSITVCKKYFNGLSEKVIENVSIDIQDKISQIHSKMWNRTEVFHFFTHTNMFNLTFPCTTMEGNDVAPGKPCSFPFYDSYSESKIETGCTTEGHSLYCITRYI